MRSFKGVVKTDICGSDVEFEFDVDDDATDEEIEKEAREVAFQYIDWWYEKEEE